MPAKAAVTPNVVIHTTVPEKVAALVQIHLWSEAEGRVPRGSLQAFLVARINEFFDSKRVDLGAFLNALPGEIIVSGNEHSINKLINHLKEVNHHE